MHLRCSIFFLRVGVGAWDSLGILCSHYVPYGSIMFPPSSQYVPNSTTLNPISFAQKFSSCNLQGETYNISSLGIPKV